MRNPKVRHWRQPRRSIRSGGPLCMLEAKSNAVYKKFSVQAALTKW